MKMAIDINKYLSHLAIKEATQRFKLNYPIEDVVELLKATYKNEVALRNKQYDAVSEQNIAKIAKWLTGDFKPGLMLYGTIGSGKSTFLRSIYTMLSITSPSNTIIYHSAIEIANLARKEEELYERAKTSKMLFIDDLGLEAKTIKSWGNESNPIAELIYHRYDKMLFTIVTHNLTDEAISAEYGDRVLDRFKEVFDRIYFNNKSFR